MEVLNSIFKLLAGIGLFLFAMYLLEESLKNLAGRNFKLFLQRSSKNTLSAAAGGALVTGVLQSSSMVSLMVLAFVGAGIFTMKSALALVLGANLGTTLDSWLVATLGFKTNIEVIAYPAVCIGGLFLILLGKRKSYKYISYFLLGFGLLFIGLSFMRTAMENQVKVFDFSRYNELPQIFFLGLGFLITLLVQSSSVTMALTLSALHVHAIDFPTAAVIALGSETGTSIKLLVSGIGGNATKKRVALGNFLFNISLTIFAFIFLKPLLYLITTIFGVADPLLGLVTFSSLINLISIAFFLPQLDRFSKFLEIFFKDLDISTAAFISQAHISEPETALDLFEREADYFVYSSILFNMELFEIDPKTLYLPPAFEKIDLKKEIRKKSLEDRYDFLKQLQGEIQAFYMKLRVKLNNEELHQLNQLASSTRGSMYASKCLNDIYTNMTSLRRSSKDILFDFFTQQKEYNSRLYQELAVLLFKDKSQDVEKLKKILSDIETNYSQSLTDFYKNAQSTLLNNIDITQVINFNRELFTSNKAILMAVKDLLLQNKEAESFNETAVYKT